MCAAPMAEKAGKGNNCDPCAEKHCKDVVANRAKLRATRLDIVVDAPLFSQGSFISLILILLLLLPMPLV